MGNKRGVSFFAYNNIGGVLTRLSKRMEGDYALMAEVLAIEQAYWHFRIDREK